MNLKSPVIASLDEAVSYTKKYMNVCVIGWMRLWVKSTLSAHSKQAALYTDSYSKANSQGQKMSLGSSWYVQKAWK